MGLQFNTIFAAANNKELSVLSNDIILNETCMLMPATPLEATFDDVAETNLSDMNILALAPVVPMVADFSDGAPITEISLLNLAPVTPKEASFEEEAESGIAGSIQNLAPATPAIADFEDCV